MSKESKTKPKEDTQANESGQDSSKENNKQESAKEPSYSESFWFGFNYAKDFFSICNAADRGDITVGYKYYKFVEKYHSDNKNSESNKESKGSDKSSKTDNSKPEENKPSASPKANDSQQLSGGKGNVNGAAK